MPVGLTTIWVMVVGCPLALVVTKTVVKDSGTVVKVLPKGLVVVRVTGAVSESGLPDEEVAESVTPLERSETRTPELVVDGEGVG